MSVVTSVASSNKINSITRVSCFILDLSHRIKRRRQSDLFLLRAAAKRKMPLAPSLRDFLKKKSRLQAFHAFLRKEFSEENLEFWVEIEFYKKQKRTKQIKLAKALFETYIQPGATRELNIDGQTRRETEANLVNPNSTTFDLVQEHVFALMERDSFRRFMVQEPGPEPQKKSALLGGQQTKVDGKKSRSPLKFTFNLRPSSKEGERSSAAR